MEPLYLVAGQAEAVVNSLGLTDAYRIDVVTVPIGHCAPPSPPTGTGVYRSSLSFGPPDEPPLDPGVYVVVELGDDGTRIQLTPEMQPLDALVHLADRLQDWVIELTHGAARPRCPGHAHPMRASVVGGSAAWTCPARPDHAIASIG
ncbi:hypothetical protein ACGF13_29080 [Kitasatospora sp. NPDC048286]|uniref:hypothetical protein n=1 Tax=Kitasatospora sp. NPDC048286 TaxID=3364047 RepID=UPI003720B90D